MATYSKKAQDKIGKVMHEMKEDKLRSGGSGKKVTNRKQAIAIGISEAREAGAKTPKKTARKTTRKSAGVKKAASSKSAPKKMATGKKAAGKRASHKRGARKTSKK